MYPHTSVGEPGAILGIISVILNWKFPSSALLKIQIGEDLTYMAPVADDIEAEVFYVSLDTLRARSISRKFKNVFIKVNWYLKRNLMQLAIIYNFKSRASHE